MTIPYHLNVPLQLINTLCMLKLWRIPGYLLWGGEPNGRGGGISYTHKSALELAELISGILLCDATRCIVHARFGMLLRALSTTLPASSRSLLSLPPSLPLSLLLSLHDNDNDGWSSWLPPKLKRLQRKKCLAYAMACLFVGFVAHLKVQQAARGV